MDILLMIVIVIAIGSFFTAIGGDSEPWPQPTDNEPNPYHNWKE
jgi:hypothetical protein